MPQVHICFNSINLPLVLSLLKSFTVFVNFASKNVISIATNALFTCSATPTAPKRALKRSYRETTYNRFKLFDALLRLADAMRLTKYFTGGKDFMAKMFSDKAASGVLFSFSRYNRWNIPMLSRKINSTEPRTYL